MAAKHETAPAPRYKLSSASVKPCHFRRRALQEGHPSGEQRSNTGLVVRPYVSVTKKYSKDVVSGETVLLQHLDHDPQNGFASIFVIQF
ncbi:hypothetical protein WJX77_005840 [Trebouxia sp. C0004]